MARDELTDEPTSVSEEIANAALEAMRESAERHGVEIEDAVVFVDLTETPPDGSPPRATAATGIEQQSDLLAMLLHRAKLVAEVLGVDLNIGTIQRPGAQG